MSHNTPFLPHLPAFPLILSPMEAITNPAFRQICKKWGADVLITEFIASDALIRDVESSIRKMTFAEVERPIGIQIFGNNATALADATAIAAAAKPDFIDINWGCPVRKIAGKGCGSGILQDIPLMVSLTKAVVVAAGNIPVSVKTRLGYDEKNKPIVEVAERLQDVGIRALSVHGRTKVQMYKGEADWTLIGKIKENPRMHIPIYGNGDITTADKALEYKSRYGVDGILIGRGAIGNPFLFQEIKAKLCDPPSCIPVGISQRINTCREHLDLLCRWRGDRYGVLEMRTHYAGYFKGLDHFKPFRMRLMSLTEVEPVLQAFNDIQQHYQPCL